MASYLLAKKRVYRGLKKALPVRKNSAEDSAANSADNPVEDPAKISNFLQSIQQGFRLQKILRKHKCRTVFFNTPCAKRDFLDHF